MTPNNKNVRELSLDELSRISGGSGFDDDSGTTEDRTIPIRCSCGVTFNVRLGEKKARCPNPNYRKMHYLNG